MFRKMRKSKDTSLSLNEITNLLERRRNGILSVNGDDGYPYGVPMDYLYKDYKIYFYSSQNGHTGDSLKKDEKVCFTVLGKSEVLKEVYAPFTKSVIIFGKCKVVEDKERAKEVFQELVFKFFPPMVAMKMIETYSVDYGALYEISIEHITGKNAVEG